MLPKSDSNERPITPQHYTVYEPYRSVEEYGPGQSNEAATLVAAAPPGATFTEFAENQEERCPILLVLDCSWSMNGEPMRELREAVEQFRRDVTEDPSIAAKVDVGVVTFNNMARFYDFVNSELFTMPETNAEGGTIISFPMELALDLCEKRKDNYRENGIAYHRPWIVLITDGLPDHDNMGRIRDMQERLKGAEEKRRAATFTIACGPKSGETAQWLTDNLTPPGRPAKQVHEYEFKELFRWLSNSQIALSKSSPGERVELPSTEGWEIV
ncbi:MAG: VWA domain-containing protein [Chloroflexi bacterium]|nr:VWA domain-containing protein [Chloroflexota bacterium]